MLNEIIRCKQRCTSDEAIAGVVHLITSEVRIFAQLLFYFAAISEVAYQHSSISGTFERRYSSSCFFLYHDFLVKEY